MLANQRARTLTNATSKDKELKLRPLTKKERTLQTQEKRRSRLTQEKDSAEYGLALGEFIQEYDQKLKNTRKRDSFSLEVNNRYSKIGDQKKQNKQPGAAGVDNNQEELDVYVEIETSKRERQHSAGAEWRSWYFNEENKNSIKKNDRSRTSIQKIDFLKKIVEPLDKKDEIVRDFGKQSFIGMLGFSERAKTEKVYKAAIKSLNLTNEKLTETVEKSID